MDYKEEKEFLDSVKQDMMGFLKTIHRDAPFEIRILTEEYHTASHWSPCSIYCDWDSIYANWTSDGKKKKICPFTIENLFELLTEEWFAHGGGNIFYTVNSPNLSETDTCTASDKHIINGGNVNAQFVDIDSPKEIRDDEKKIAEWRDSVLQRIGNSPLSPSITLWTRNGFHVYWLLENGESDKFKNIQMQLVQYFDGDPKCVNFSRVLRFPFFAQPAYRTLKSEYSEIVFRDDFIIQCLLYEPELRYTQGQLMNAFPTATKETVKKAVKSQIKEKHYTVPNVQGDKVIQTLCQNINLVHRDTDKIILHCCMPDHPDNNPSAWIDLDYMYYHCSGCGASLSVYELAEKLEWQDVLDAMDFYDLDVQKEIQKVKDIAVTVDDLEHLSMNESEQKRCDEILNVVLDSFHSFGQYPNAKHEKAIYDIIQIAIKANMDMPHLIALVMGAGKSILIDEFIISTLTYNPTTGFIVVKERIEDVVATVEKINNAIPNSAYAYYGFDEKDCLEKKDKCDHFSGKYRCPESQECRYITKKKQQKKFPVLVMTTEMLYIYSDKLNEFDTFTTETRESYPREWLLIDEKLKLLFNEKRFDNEVEDIFNKIKRTFNNHEDFNFLKPFEDAYEMVMKIFETKRKCREVRFNPQNDSFYFEDGFKQLFINQYGFESKEYALLEFIESVIKYGGIHISEPKFGISKIITAHYKEYDFRNFKTLIFDGTAIIDPEYKHEEYYLFDFGNLRDFSNFTIHRNNNIKASKTSMEDSEKLESVANEIKKIAQEKSNEKIYITVFKDLEDKMKFLLNDEIESGQVMIAHYGATKGSNRFKDCSTIIIVGILHKTEDYYTGKAFAKYNDISDFSVSMYGKKRRFNDPRIEKIKIMDMITDYSQEGKRINQRDNTQNVYGEMYIFHDDKLLMENIGIAFPECEYAEWLPSNVINFEKFAGTKNPTEQRIFNYILESEKRVIPYSEIIVECGISKKQLSNILRKKDTMLFFSANQIIIESMPHDKRAKQIVKLAVDSNTA